MQSSVLLMSFTFGWQLDFGMRSSCRIAPFQVLHRNNISPADKEEKTNSNEQIKGTWPQDKETYRVLQIQSPENQLLMSRIKKKSNFLAFLLFCVI